MRHLRSARVVAILLLFAFLASALTARASRPTNEELRPSLLPYARLQFANAVPLPRSVAVALAQVLQAHGIPDAALVSDEHGNLIYVGPIHNYVQPPLQENDRVARASLNPHGGPCCLGDGYIKMDPQLASALQNVLVKYDLRGAAFTINEQGKLIEFGKREELEQLQQDAKFKKHPDYDPIPGVDAIQVEDDAG